MLLGFVENPFAFLSRAHVFVLCSDWEGLPGSLIQALACGTPVIATDCDSGPREILKSGEHGRLIPVGDVGRLSDAIQAALSEPRRSPPAERLSPLLRVGRRRDLPPDTARSRHTQPIALTS